MNDISVSPRRVGLVGAGYIADWHVKCLASVAGVRVAAVCDTALSRAQLLAARTGTNAYASLDAMLAAEKLDAVHILLPPHLHFFAAKACLEAGVAVFLEKPMCATAAECDELVELAAARGVRLGVSHNFLFTTPWLRLRADIDAGRLGPIDEIRIAWNRFLPQSVYGPFDTWMLRDPRNIALEIGAHAMAFAYDLVGEPDQLDVRVSDTLTLPTGVEFYRRWQIDASKGRTAIDVRMRFIPAFSEFNVHVRGTLAAATVDCERNTYTLHRNLPKDMDFENCAMVTEQAKGQIQQARRTLKSYILSKLHMEKRGTPYAESIGRAMDAFYVSLGNSAPPDSRIAAITGARVIRICERVGELAHLPAVQPAPPAPAPRPARVLVLGGTGFIGKELVRQLIEQAESVRLLARNASSLPAEVRNAVDVVRGDTGDRASLLKAMEGVACVIHLARPMVKTWQEYQKYEVEAARTVAECALEAGVQRFVYTGTIDSYYAGHRAGTITEQTPLDPQIAHRNLYARAKAASEEILLALHRERALPLVIVRPAIVIGRGGSPFHWGIGMWWSSTVCQIWGKGENLLPLVLVEDVARGLIAAMRTPGIEGRSFNLSGDVFLTAHEYLDALDRAGKMSIDRRSTPIWHFYLLDMFKWLVKVAVRFPERRMPSYSDWESRTQKARFDCTAAKQTLGWQPEADRDAFIRKGIDAALEDFLK
jgi:predicted dehydrogenase/nucleoside-diphosphate-sugar epimerase